MRMEALRQTNYVNTVRPAIFIMQQVNNLLHRKTGMDDLRLDFIAYTHIQIPSKIQMIKKRSHHAIRRVRFAVPRSAIP